VSPPRRDDPHVLFVCSSLEVGGAERQLSLLVPLLREHGLQPAVVAIRNQGRFFDLLRKEGIWMRFLEVRSRFDLPGMRRAVVEVGAWPEVVVSQGLDAQAVGQLIARRAGVPHVTVHHTPPELRLALHRRLLTRLLARRIDRVVAVSATQIPALVSRGFPRDRIQVIENGVPEPRVTTAAAVVRSDLGLGEAEFVALLVATLRPEKRAGVFVDAVVAANRRDPRIRGLIAGAGPDLEEVRARAAGSHAVAVLGERADVADLMAASDVICLTSSAEASPMVVLEAMALGRAVIATDVGGVADVVVAGETGVLMLVDQGDDLARRLCELAETPAVVSAMGEAGRRRYGERFSAGLMAERYASMLRELVGAG
jgi:glycosyltransferase involved in cell wall biosynthesis